MKINQFVKIATAICDREAKWHIYEGLAAPLHFRKKGGVADAEKRTNRDRHQAYNPNRYQK